MAENMIKFLRGNVANLPQTATPGALYFTKDEGIYLGLENGAYHRYGDFIIVANVDALPASGAHATCMYYCTQENILCRYDSANSKWVQINKQPTAEEMKTLLGLGSLAYLSEVAEDNLSSALKEKVNAAAEGNHAHANKTVLDGITAEKVAAWDAAEGNAKGHADGLNTAMNARVEALEAVDHSHTNKALLDTYTQTEENLADAVAKKHEHTNKTELDKIAAGDKAKWDAVVADHLVAADKTALEDSIGDVNTALGEEVTRAKAAEKANADAIAAIKDGVAVDSFADVEAELAKKVDKVTGKSLVDDAEITKLAGVSAGANKVEASETNGKIKIDGVETTVYTHPAKHSITDIEGLQDALDGKQGSGDFAAEDHKHVKADITDFAHTHAASEITDLDATIKTYDYATKAEAQGYANAKDEAIAAAQSAADKAQDEVDALELVVAEKAAQSDLEALETYVGTIPETATATNIVAYVQEKTAGIATDTALEELTGRVKNAEDAIDAIEADYLKAADKTELSDAIGAEKTRAEGIEAGLRTDVDAIKADYLKAADKEALQTQINTIMNNPDAEGAINSINEFTQYVADHGTIADGFRKDIDKNKDDIAAEAKRAGEAESALSGRLDTLEAIDNEAYVAADTALKGELNAEIAKKADATALAAAVEALEGADAELAAAIEEAKTDASNKDAVVLAEAQAYADQAEADAIAAAKTETENQVKALAEGAVADNAADIADIMEILAWGEF